MRFISCRGKYVVSNVLSLLFIKHCTIHKFKNQRSHENNIWFLIRCIVFILESNYKSNYVFWSNNATFKCVRIHNQIGLLKIAWAPRGCHLLIHATGSSRGYKVVFTVYMRWFGFYVPSHTCPRQYTFMPLFFLVLH